MRFPGMTRHSCQLTSVHIHVQAWDSEIFGMRPLQLVRAVTSLVGAMTSLVGAMTPLVGAMTS